MVLIVTALSYPDVVTQQIQDIVCQEIAFLLLAINPTPGMRTRMSERTEIAELSSLRSLIAVFSHRTRTVLRTCPLSANYRIRKLSD